MIDHATRNPSPRHLLKTHSLRGYLYRVVQPVTAGAMLVFHGTRGSVRQELHEIRFTDKPKTLVYQRHCTLYPDPVFNMRAGLIDVGVDPAAAQCIDIFGKGLFQMNERALAGTVTVVLQRRDHDWIGTFLHSFMTFSSPPCDTTHAELERIPQAKRNDRCITQYKIPNAFGIGGQAIHHARIEADR
jgi:hypothetical protein